MKTKLKLFLALLCVIIFASAPSPTFAQNKAEKIDTLMTTYHKYGQFNGAVLVAENGRVVYQKGFGSANFEWNNPNTPDTKFRIASITKSFTAILIFRLIEQGKLKLNGKVTDYLSDYPKATGDKILINHLLTHTAGLRGDVTNFPRNSNNFPDYVAKINAGFTGTDELVKRISEPDLASEPGAKFGYSNNGYILLGAIIEKVTGKPYEKVLDEQILAPLKMRNTGLAYKTSVLNKRADGYDRSFYGYRNAADILVAANGGMYSTVGDLFLLDEALHTDKLLSQMSKEVMFSVTPYIVAYGWKVKKSAAGTSGKVIETDGSLPGFNSLMVRLIDGKNTIVLLTNVREMTYRLSDISLGLTSILDGNPYNLPKQSIAEAIFTTTRQQGIEAALRQYQTLRRDKTYYLNETEFNTIGYALKGENKIKEAIEIFKLNTEAHPQSANAYDSLGEAYMENGDKELAIKNYQKSVELDPNNTNGIEMLRKLRGENITAPSSVKEMKMFQGLRTVIYHVDNLEKAKAWYAEALGIKPYFDQPFYVGFNVGGFELGLDPDMTGVSKGNNAIAYWGVKDAAASYKRMLDLGAKKHSEVMEVGGGIRVATVTDPSGNVFGIIENPNFKPEGNE